MKIGLVGATGQVGSHLLKYLLEDNHEVRVLVRNPEKLNELKEHQSVEVLTGSATTAENVAKLCEGMDIVVSCLGGDKNGPLIMKTCMENLLKANPTKLMAVTSLGLGGSSTFVNLALKMVVGRGPINDGDAADALLVHSRTVPVFVVRPTALDNSPPNGKYEATKAGGFRFSPISRQDVALFMKDKINEGWSSTEAVQLYCKK